MATDDFDRADGGLGSNWAVVRGSASISSNAVAFGSTDTIIRYETGTWADDQEASFTTTGSLGGVHCGGGVRLQATTGAGYVC